MKVTTITPAVRSVSALRTLAFAFSVTLLVSACDAQKPTAVATAKSSSQGFRWSEPSLTGKIVDAETGLPVKGAFVYGHYATSTGTLAGGSKFGEHVRSFAVETDADGVFKLEAWNTGDRLIQGERRGKWPMIAVYKPGYQLDLQHMNSIHHWQALITTLGIPQIIDPNTIIDDKPIDRRSSPYPYKLKPAKTERERFEALDLSSYAMMFDGECGWELYAGLLLAQHRETKQWIRDVVPPSQIDADGYGKDTYFHPDPMIRGYSKRTSHDKLLSAFRANRSSWKCADPTKLNKGDSK